MATSAIHVADLLTLQRVVLEQIARREPERVVLEALCRLVERLVPKAVCSVMRYDPKTNRLALLAAPSAPESICQRLDGMEVSESSGNCAVAVERKEIVIVEDTSVDPLWKDYRALAKETGIRSCWSVPFFSARGKVLGSLGISRAHPGGPEGDQLELLRTAGTLAGMAVDFVGESKHFREREALLRCIIESSEDPIFAKDIKGRYLIANPAETREMLARPDEAIGLTDEDLFPDHVATCRQTDEEVMRTGKSVLYEHEFEHPTRGRRVFLIRKGLLKGPEGEVRGVLGISRDVTDLRRAEEAMRRAQKLEWLGVLTGGIAHDFNNLLTGILGNAELALSQLPSGSPERTYVFEVQRAAVRASELIRQMQAYAGTGGHQRKISSLPEIVSEIVELLTSSIGKNADLNFDIRRDLPPVEVDATQIRQVVMNLVTNASEALEGAVGTIRIEKHSVARDQLSQEAREIVDPKASHFVALRVVDSGRGMDSATQARIFDPFFSTKFEGRGLGLAATLGIVHRHGGAIDVQSQPNEGSRFTVYLPAANSPVEKETDAPSTDQAWRSSGRVLIVDDEPMVLDLAKRILQKAGFETVTASDGAQAIARLEATTEDFDLVILDHTMPGLDAAHTLSRLRSSRPGLTVILSSGHPEQNAREGFREKLQGDPQLAGFLKKPYGPADMLDVVRSAISSR